MLRCGNKPCGLFRSSGKQRLPLVTVIEGKPRRDVSDPQHYEGMKKRRQRAIFAIKQYLANKLKLQV